jgi:LytS/YehU family sensor histidine kinase
MRLILENSSEDYITIEEEIETLTNYLDIQKVRFKDSFNYNINYSENIVPSEISIPPMIAQPFIENSLEHGLLPKDGLGIIKVNFALKNDFIEFSIEDNGVGLEQSANLKEKNTKHKSRATQIIKDRLYLLSKELKKEVELDIVDVLDSSGNVKGAKVKIKLPIKYC